MERKVAGSPINTSQNGIAQNQVPATNQNIPQQGQVVNNKNVKFLGGELVLPLVSAQNSGVEVEMGGDGKEK